MNIIGIVFLLLGSNGLGYCLCRQKMSRRRQIEELAELLNLVQAEIRCHQSVLEEAFLAIRDRLSGWRYDFLCNLLAQLQKQDGRTLQVMWKQAVREIAAKTCLKGEEIQLWTEVGERIGFLDLQMQNQVLAQYVDRLQKTAASLEKEEAQTCRLYRVLSAAGGLLLAVLLL